MKNILKAVFVVLIVTSILLASALLTPLIFRILPFFKFERIFRRLVTIFVVGLAIFVVSREKWSWKRYGFDFSVSWRSLFLYGLIGGAITLGIMTLAETVWGPYFVRDNISIGRTIEWFFKGLVSGISIGFLEEFFFRGFVYKQLESRVKVVAALILTNIFYAAVHFWDSRGIFVQNPPTFHDGIHLLKVHLSPFLNTPMETLPQFMGLFIFGLVLNFAFLRTRTLFLSIGIHAGVVFLIKFQKAIVLKETEGHHWLWRHLSLYDAPVEWVIVSGLLLILVFFLVPKKLIKDSK